jgi:hypothetical protein
MCNNSFLTMTFCGPFSALKRCFAFWTSWNRKDTLGKSSCNRSWSEFYQHNWFYTHIKGNFICLLSFYEILSIVSASHSHMLSDHCWCQSLIVNIVTYSISNLFLLHKAVNLLMKLGWDKGIWHPC